MIPLKLEKLLQDRTVERDRIEYKGGWNPDETIRTICAFANDFNNTNGGYVVIGIEASKATGRPILPPVGIDEDDLDKVQQKLFEYCNLIFPRYIPQIEIVEYQNKHILYLWCSGGDSGPYSAPAKVTSKDAKDRHKEYWIRPASVTAIAKGEELSELFSKFNSLPFDDRINRKATVNDITYGYLEEFLRKSGSSLVGALKTSTIEDLLLSLEVANETDVGIDIRNIGVLMFSSNPHKLIPGAQIDLVKFNSPEEEGGDFTEITFTGPIYKQINDAMSYIKTFAITEKVVKVSNRMEAERYFSYPYDALEEVLVNAIFHKSYMQSDPVEIRMYLDYIMVLNYPGPAKWIDMEKLAAGKIRGRSYRNRRIGEFLKELDLSEKQSTGIRKILRELKNNGSPPPEFETDIERMHCAVTIRRHKGFKDSDLAYYIESDTGNEYGVGESVRENITISDTINDTINITINDTINETQQRIIRMMTENPRITASELSKEIGINERNIKNNIKTLKEADIITRDGARKNGRWVVKINNQ